MPRNQEGCSGDSRDCADGEAECRRKSASIGTRRRRLRHKAIQSSRTGGAITRCRPPRVEIGDIESVSVRHRNDRFPNYGIDAKWEVYPDNGARVQSSEVLYTESATRILAAGTVK